MTNKHLLRAVVLTGALLLPAVVVNAQSGSTRPRRVKQPAPTERPEPGTSAATSDEPLLDVTPATNNSTTKTTPANRPSAARPMASDDTSRAYALLEQKQYAAAAREAKRIADSDPNNAEAWKIAGFAEINLQQFKEAASDLQRALDLQRAAGREDANTVDALAQALVRTDEYERALPLLVAATTRAGAVPDPFLLSMRGIAEYRTGKMADAERSFNAAVKANPKDAGSLFYLGRIAYEQNKLDAAIAALNRATTADARSAAAWGLLTTAYLRRAALATEATKTEADYLSAVRAGESLTRVRSDAEAVTLFAQALIGAKQYARAAAALERAALDDDAKGITLYLLGVSHSRAKNYPKAIAALERAATKSPNDVNIYRELGYAAEVSKQYAKALAAYQKGAQLAPNDADFKTSVERVRPFAQ